MTTTPSPEITPAKKPKKVRIKEKPGTIIMSYGVVACVLSIIFTIISAASTTTDAYGYQTHGGISGGTIILFLLGLVLMAVGFGRRVLAALEAKGEPRD